MSAPRAAIAPPTPAATRGKGLALVAGSAALLALLAVTGYANLSAKRAHEDELNAVTFLKDTLTQAQTAFREQDLDGDGVHAYARDLAELARYGLIPDEYADGHAHGYAFAMRRGRLAPEFTWIAVASPTARSGPEPARYFGIDHSGVLRLSTAPIPLSADATFPPDLTQLCTCGHREEH